MKWAANYPLAVEVSRTLINLILDKFLQVLKSQNSHVYTKNLGVFCSFTAELTGISVPDLNDPPPVGGGVWTNLDVTGDFSIKLFRFLPLKAQMKFSLRDVSFDFAASNAGLPSAIVISSTPDTKVQVAFPKASFLIGWILNLVVGPLISFGVWIVIKLIKKMEVPVWELVDVFAALGLRFSPGSPLLTAQNRISPDSLLLASGFNLTGAPTGDPNQLGPFLPANTNIGGVIHERIAVAGVQLAFSKGWVPKKFKVNKWNIYINTIQVRFVQDKIEASGKLKAKRGSCWCRVKVSIRFKAAVEPKVTTTPAGTPLAEFKYDADINTRVSTSGMLVVLGAIMLAPLFMSLTIVLSALVNILLDKFLPFTTQFQIAGGTLSVTVKSINFSGFVPFQMQFPLVLTGQGTYDLTPFRQFELPGKVPLSVGFTPETISVQPEELRAAVGLG